jgi:hypothetical protein
MEHNDNNQENVEIKNTNPANETENQNENKQKKKKTVKKKIAKNLENESNNVEHENISHNSDGMNEVFLSSSQDNAKRIVNQFGEIQNNADDYIFSLISSMQNFEIMKKNLNNKYNYFFRTLFSFLGYDYHTNIPKVNFFIFSTQAWFIEFAKLLEKKYNEIKVLESNKIITYANVLGIMKQDKVPENCYLQNLGILTSSLLNQNALTSLIIENNIGKTFLIQLNLLLHEIKDYEPSEVDKKAFDDIVSGIFKDSVERTLNHMENQFSEKIEFIQYSAIYENLKKEVCDHTIEDMFEKVKAVQQKEDSLNLYSLRISTESFYYYAQVKIDDIINDINLFTNNYTSIMFKTKKLLGQGINNVMQYNERLFFLIRRIINYLENTKSNLNNLRKESLDKFYNLYNNVTGMGNEIIDKVNYKKWIQSSFIVSDEIKEYTKKLLIENPLELYKLYLNNYITPAVDYSLNKTEGIRKYITTEWEMSMEEYQNLKTNLSNYLKSKYENASINLKNILLVTTEDNKVKLRLSDKLAFLNPTVVFDIYYTVEDYAKSFKNNVNQILEKGKDYSYQKMNEIKEYSCNMQKYYIRKFKNLLQLRENK